MPNYVDDLSERERGLITERRLKHLEQELSERNEEMYKTITDITVATSFFEQFKEKNKAIEQELQEIRKQQHETARDLHNILTAFGALRWFFSIVIPMLVGIMLMQIFKLEGLPWGS